MQIEVRVYRGDNLLEQRQLDLKDPITVGRDASADVRIRDLAVSRQHVILSQARKGIEVEDLGSQTGTRLNGNSLGEDAVVAELPCQIELGRHRLEIAAVGTAKGVWFDYERGEVLGEGGFGRVYAARRRADGEQVAVKEIKLSGSEELLARFAREARLCEGLDHPNLVQIHEVRVEGDKAYQVMERVNGEDLAEHVMEEGILSFEQAYDVLVGTALAVQAMHDAGVIHRDLKPGNVMLTSRGQVKVTDFGLARSQESGETLTKSLMGMGTLAFMAPEQGLDAKRAGPAADLYGIGATIYYALTGQAPFVSDYLEELLDGITGSEPTPIRALRPDCPVELAKIVHRLLGKAPDERYPSAKILLERVEEIRVQSRARKGL